MSATPCRACGRTRATGCTCSYRAVEMRVLIAAAAGRLQGNRWRAVRPENPRPTTRRTP